MIHNDLVKKLQEITGEESVQLTFSDNLEHGDYTTNVAMVIASKNKENPRSKAEEIIKKLEEDKELKKYLSKIEVAGPGFINFFLSKTFIEKELADALQKDDAYGSGNQLSKQKVIIEYTDPNPFKELHIGHLYSNIVGESLSRLIESQGADVKRACYQGDVGLHVAKALWGIESKFKSEGISIEDVEKYDLNHKVKFLGEAYALGATAYEEDTNAAEEIKILNQKVFSKDPQIMEIYTKGREWSLEYFGKIYERLGTKFDYFFFESEVGDDGVNLVNSHIDDGIFEKSEGAVIFKGEKYGLHTRVFINKLGLPTYEAKELGLAPKKYELFKYDKSIIVTANEINEYFKVLIKALSLINPDLASKTKHIGHGFVKLPGGKMSSRKGNIVTAEYLIDLSKEKARELQNNRENTNISDMVGMAAIKYAFLKNNIGGDIEYDIDKSVSFEGNSGPYLQYTSVRAKGILEKSKADGVSTEIGEKELPLMRLVLRFPQVVATAANDYSPSYLCTYLYLLAQNFNRYYDTVKIIGEKEENMRLNVVKATNTVLINGLKLLGIDVPEKM